MKPHSVWDHVEIDHIADLTLYPMTIYPICSVSVNLWPVDGLAVVDGVVHGDVPLEGDADGHEDGGGHGDGEEGEQEVREQDQVQLRRQLMHDEWC